MGMKVPKGLCHGCLQRSGGAKYCESCRPPSKYRSRKTKEDGLKFDSQKEADRYRLLAQLQKGGVICGLRCQVRYPIVVNGIKVTEYVADFVYHDGPNPEYPIVVEDVKGFKTRVYNMKAKLLLAVYGITIREV